MTIRGDAENRTEGIASETARAAATGSVLDTPVRIAERERVLQRYERRKLQCRNLDYSPLDPAIYMASQERERAIIRWVISCGIAPVSEKRLIEIGCGGGGNLLTLLKLGFQPHNLVANELIAERAASAREVLPNAVEVIVGDACALDLDTESFDVVFQSTVFTSILDRRVQQELADSMWRLVRPGGGVLWYDFVYDNPSNRDVRGLPLRMVRTLFPEGRINSWKLTLAPPINRRATRVYPPLYSLLNLAPFLRTHILCWIQKPLQ